MRTNLTLLFLALAASVGCANILGFDEGILSDAGANGGAGTTSGGTRHSGGSNNAGGTGLAGNGLGGTVSSAGTTSRPGGAASTGGTANTSGTTATGGTAVSIGTKATGGLTSTGSTGAGGNTVISGTIATGGTTSSGGTTTGANTVTGGTKATGGTTSVGVAGSARGGAATGGVRANGGNASLTGGAKTAGGATSAGGSTSVASGVTTGDTHLLTFDGAFYDFQAAGEFVLTSDGDGFTVQVRQEPWTSCTTVNTAVAIQAGPNRLAFYARKPNLLRINGQPTTMNCPNVSLQSLSVSSLTCTLNLGDNYVIAFDGTVYSVRWPNSARAVEVTPMTGYLNVSLWDSPGSPMLGLLGDGNGNPRNDLKLADGTVLAIPVSFDDLYSRFAGAWRINPEQSLFDYDSGESTQSFTQGQFPPEICDASTLPVATRMNGRKICQSHGILDAPLLEACTLDVAMFGNSDAVEAFTDLPTPVLTIPILPDTFESPNDDNY